MARSEVSAERKAYVIEMVERLAGTDWPPNIARRLDYANEYSLKTQLERWGRHDLARRFSKVNYDGLVPLDRITKQARRDGAAV